MSDREVSCTFFPPSTSCGPYEGCCEGSAEEPGWDECWYESDEGRYGCASPDDCDEAITVMIADVCE